MKIEQIYTGCLAQGTYYITSDGDAAIIDPLRDIKQYLDLIKRDKVKLKYIFETHFHADFVSGHLDLSRETGAPIIYGPGAKGDFNFTRTMDGQEFKLGKTRIKVLHTPGHTMESSCFLLFDENGVEYAIFSGDTLLLGDVGRPDLAQKAANLTKEELAGLLYDSIVQKILPLPDHVLVYPGHGPGSACGKNMMNEKVDTLGHQKQVNYALKQVDRPSFINEVLDGLLPPPGYFGMNVNMNKKGYDRFEDILEKSLKACTPGEFEQVALSEGAVMLDLRNHSDFCKEFIPGSINIGLDGSFAPWVGTVLVDVKQPILLVTYPGKEEEAVSRLSRVGFDNVLGFLKGGISSWIGQGREVEIIDRICASQFLGDIVMTPNIIVIDVRKPWEYALGHIGTAINKPLDYINEWVKDLDHDAEYYLYCAGGYRSMIAASYMKANGFMHLSELEGGYNVIPQPGLLTEEEHK